MLNSLKQSTHVPHAKKATVTADNKQKLSCIGGPNYSFYIEGQILNPVDKNMSEPINFLIDTGLTSAVLLSKNIADSLGITKLPLVKNIETELADSSIRNLSVYRAVLILEDIQISTLISIIDSEKPFAAVGTPLLSHFDMSIANGKCQITRREPAKIFRLTKIYNKAV